MADGDNPDRDPAVEELAHALRTALTSAAAEATVLRAYPAGSSQRALLRGALERALANDPGTLGFFGRLLS
jgi:hypothetical protein